MGGHVIFSHDQYFDELLDTAVGAGPDAWNTLERVSYVWIKGRWVAYPFQNNISALDKDDQARSPLLRSTIKGSEPAGVTTSRNCNPTLPLGCFHIRREGLSRKLWLHCNELKYSEQYRVDNKILERAHVK